LKSLNQAKPAVSRQSGDASKTLVYWTASLMLVGAFLLGDVAVVSWSAGVASASELSVAYLTFMFIAMGVIVTQYKMTTYRPKRLDVAACGEGARSWKANEPPYVTTADSTVCEPVPSIQTARAFAAGAGSVSGVGIVLRRRNPAAARIRVRPRSGRTPIYAGIPAG
jgi:hypothetical protein